MKKWTDDHDVEDGAPPAKGRCPPLAKASSEPAGDTPVAGQPRGQGASSSHAVVLWEHHKAFGQDVDPSVVQALSVWLGVPGPLHFLLRFSFLFLHSKTGPRGALEV